MRCLVMLVAVVVLAVPAWAAQPFGISLNPNGVSYIYPVFNTGGWVITQPTPSQVYNSQDRNRITHWADDFYAQDWSRACGETHGQPVFAGISGQIVMAGDRGPYGNTVVIHDAQSGFALKYSHLSEISVQKGEYVIAGMSLLGRVGNTGNIQSTGCNSSPGAHLHLSLHKKVTNPSTRPITSTVATVNAGPTEYAAAFGYATSVDLVKASNNPTVFARFAGLRVPVSAAAFSSHGWGFDKHQSLFNPLQGRIVSGFANDQPVASYFFPLREFSLIKAGNESTVYQFEDGYKRALSYETFTCRGNRFLDIITVSFSDKPSYLPSRDVNAIGCLEHVQQALRDLPKYGQLQLLPSSGLLPDWSSYGYYPDWSPAWELRWLNFKLPNSQTITIYHILNISRPTERHLAYWNHQTGQWYDWQRIQ